MNIFGDQDAEESYMPDANELVFIALGLGLMAITASFSNIQNFLNNSFTVFGASILYGYGLTAIALTALFVSNVDSITNWNSPAFRSYLPMMVILTGMAFEPNLATWMTETTVRKILTIGLFLIGSVSIVESSKIASIDSLRWN